MVLRDCKVYKSWHLADVAACRGWAGQGGTLGSDPSGWQRAATYGNLMRQWESREHVLMPSFCIAGGRIYEDSRAKGGLVTGPSGGVVKTMHGPVAKAR